MARAPLGDHKPHCRINTDILPPGMGIPCCTCDPGNPRNVDDDPAPVRARTLTIELTPALADAIECYLATDYSDGRDPSKFGALNAVAYIGECVAALYAAVNPLEK